jgi:hypothetical protein
MQVRGCRAADGGSAGSPWHLLSTYPLLTRHRLQNSVGIKGP